MTADPKYNNHNIYADAKSSNNRCRNTYSHIPLALLYNHRQSNTFSTDNLYSSSHRFTATVFCHGISQHYQTNRPGQFYYRHCPSCVEMSRETISCRRRSRRNKKIFEADNKKVINHLLKIESTWAGRVVNARAWIQQCSPRVFLERIIMGWLVEISHTYLARHSVHWDVPMRSVAFPSTHSAPFCSQLPTDRVISSPPRKPTHLFHTVKPSPFLYSDYTDHSYLTFFTIKNIKNCNKNVWTSSRLVLLSQPITFMITFMILRFSLRFLN